MHVLANFLETWVNQRFFKHLIRQTDNFSQVTWLGKPIWQNILDLWVIQETIWQIQPELIIECGTNRGGSAFFYAQLFDLMGRGRVVTIDLEKMHNLSHPRIDFIIGDSIANETVGKVKMIVGNETRSVMVILDSKHKAQHVTRELELYSPFVTKGSYILVQDGVIDTLPMLRAGRPGPLVATRDFLRHNKGFSVDNERCQRFLVTHHPMGWLKKI